MLRYRGFQALWLAVAFLCQYSAAWDLEPPAGFRCAFLLARRCGSVHVFCRNLLVRRVMVLKSSDDLMVLGDNCMSSLVYSQTLIYGRNFVPHIACNCYIQTNSHFGGFSSMQQVTYHLHRPRQTDVYL